VLDEPRQGLAVLGSGGAVVGRHEDPRDGADLGVAVLRDAQHRAPGLLGAEVESRRQQPDGHADVALRLDGFVQVRDLVAQGIGVGGRLARS